VIGIRGILVMVDTESARRTCRSCSRYRTDGRLEHKNGVQLLAGR
jgi:hypothetical protein